MLLKDRGLLACVVVCGLVLTAWKHNTQAKPNRHTHMRRRFTAAYFFSVVANSHTMVLKWRYWINAPPPPYLPPAFRFPPLLKLLWLYYCYKEGGGERERENKISFRVFATSLETYRINIKYNFKKMVFIKLHNITHIWYLVQEARHQVFANKIVIKKTSS